MPGHGTVITTSTGQDDSTIYVDDDGGSSNFARGTSIAVNMTGGTLNVGDVVNVDWDSESGSLHAQSVGNRATGDVDASGARITITNSGDTVLSGTVDISTSHGENEGWAGADGVRCGNVNGEAAYLSE